MYALAIGAKFERRGEEDFSVRSDCIRAVSDKDASDIAFLIAKRLFPEARYWDHEIAMTEISDDWILEKAKEIEADRSRQKAKDP